MVPKFESTFKLKRCSTFNYKQLFESLNLKVWNSESKIVFTYNLNVWKCKPYSCVKSWNVEISNIHALHVDFKLMFELKLEVLKTKSTELTNTRTFLKIMYKHFYLSLDYKIRPTKIRILVWNAKYKIQNMSYKDSYLSLEYKIQKYEESYLSLEYKIQNRAKYRAVPRRRARKRAR